MPELGIACLLSAVADVQAKRQRNMTTFHPRADDNGKHRQILKPSQPTDLGTWSDPSAIARAVPDSTMPDLIGDVSVAAWNDAPATSEDWELLVKGLTFSEPPMPSALGVASRTIIRSLVKQMRALLIPLLHGLHRRLAAQR